VNGLDRFHDLNVFIFEIEDAHSELTNSRHIA
jgi:hypothetical protein